MQYSEKDLEKLNKQQLLEVASTLSLNGLEESSKAEIRAAILAQVKINEESEEEIVVSKTALDTTSFQSALAQELARRSSKVSIGIHKPVASSSSALAQELARRSSKYGNSSKEVTAESASSALAQELARRQAAAH